MKFSRIMDAIFLLVGVLTILEFIYVRGMFTWFIAVVATIIAGAIEIFYSLKEKQFMKAALVLLSVVALCMGYFVLG